MKLDPWKINSFLAQCSNLIPPKGTKKTFGFLVFSGVSNGNTGQKWVKDINNIKQILKRNRKMEVWMPAHIEYAKRTFNMLILLTKNYNVFSTRTPLL